LFAALIPACIVGWSAGTWIVAPGAPGTSQKRFWSGQSAAQWRYNKKRDRRRMAEARVTPQYHGTSIAPPLKSAAYPALPTAYLPISHLSPGFPDTHFPVNYPQR